MVVLSLDDNYHQMVKPLHENFRVKVFSDDSIIIQWTTFMGQNNQKLILGKKLIKIIS
jgi:hypothetical protein